MLIGAATRLARFYTASAKAYEARIRFGFSTDTYDADGEANGAEPVAFTKSDLERELERFRGPIQMIPPPFSAKKIKGTPAYKLARAKKEVILAPVDVQIYDIQVANFDGDCADLTVQCSAGTYVRTLAHDLGQRLGCGAHLQTLRRTASGEFDIAKAYTIEELERLSADGTFSAALIPAARLLPDFPEVHVDERTSAGIRQGRDFRANPFQVRPETRHVKAISHAGSLLAIGEAILPHLYHPVVVLS